MLRIYFLKKNSRLCQIQWHIIINLFPWTSKASIFRCFCISTHLWCFCFIQSAPGCVQGVRRQSGWYCHLARVSKPCEAQLKGQKDMTFRTPWVGSLGARYLQDSQAPQLDVTCQSNSCVCRNDNNWILSLIFSYILFIIISHDLFSHHITYIYTYSIYIYTYNVSEAIVNHHEPPIWFDGLCHP